MKKIINFSKNFNLPLLFFLIFFLNVKFTVKVIALIFIIFYHRDWKFGFSWKQSRLPLFYLAMIVVEAFKYVVVTRNYSLNYSFVFCMGMVQWALSLLAIHYLKLAVEKTKSENLHNTIRAFFFLNFLVSLFFLMLLLIHPSWLSYWGHAPDISYTHVSAGDTILGISFDTSTVNATINGFGLVYFLFKKDYIFSFINVFILLLCTSNVTFLLTLCILILMILTVRSKKLRISTLLFSLAFVLVYFFISPTNRVYIRNYFAEHFFVKKTTSPTTDSSVRSVKAQDGTVSIKTEAIVSADSVHSKNEKKSEKGFFNMNGIKEIKKNGTMYLSISTETYRRLPGKLISFEQTYNYLLGNKKHFFFGSGIGNFSSKLAFRASGINALGTYPKKYKYISPDFQDNHLQTFLFYYNSDGSQHSVLNYPFSVYNQIFGEYGLTGAFCFIIFYLGYFVAKLRSLTYGRYMIFMLLGFFVMEYWFEFFSLVVIFELFILLNIKEGSQERTIPAGNTAKP
jgi:hypothetical protein